MSYIFSLVAHREGNYHSHLLYKQTRLGGKYFTPQLRTFFHSFLTGAALSFRKVLMHVMFQLLQERNRPQDSGLGLPGISLLES